MVNTLQKNQSKEQTIEFLSQQRGIPVDWLEAHCKRDRDGWLITGANYQQQKRLDKPRTTKDGKQVKYVSHTKDKQKYDIFIPVEPTFGLPITDDYDRDATLVITEGAFKAIKGCSEGVLTVSVPGVNQLFKPKESGGDLVNGLHALTIRYKKIIIAFDADASFKPQVWDAIKKGAMALIERDCDVKIAVWQHSEETKGMDDYINKEGIEAFKLVLENALALDAWEHQYPRPEDKASKTKRTKAREAIEKYYGDRLQWNELKQRIELDGTQYKAGHAYIDIDKDICIELPKELAMDLMVYVARQKAYHPVANYLSSLENYGIEHSIEYGTVDSIKYAMSAILQSVADIHDDLAQTILIKWLVSGVARIFEPGCKVDMMPIFYGRQGIGKSSFLRELCPQSDWFSDDHSGTGDKDAMMLLNQFWILEIAEFEKIYSKSDAETLKAIVTKLADTYRAPYDKDLETHFRRCILAATANSQDFLRDSSGDRRYPVIALHQKVNIPLLIEKRDELWFYAMQLYRLGYQWHTTPEEDAKVSINNAAYRGYDIFGEAVADAVKFPGSPHGLMEKTRIDYVWEKINAHKSPLPDLTQKDSRAIANALKQLGYEQKNVWTDGSSKKFWVLTSPITSLPEFSDSGQGEVRHTQQELQPFLTSLPQIKLLKKNTKVAESIVDDNPYAHLDDEKESLKSGNEVMEASNVDTASLTSPLPDLVDSGNDAGNEVKIGDRVTLMVDHSFALAGTALEVVGINDRYIRCLRCDRKQNQPASLREIIVLADQVQLTNS
ncbi:VapE domain-containing protein [Nostoc sp. PCC 7120 = FACHB-418]|uniref:VapE domain-containing protein n=1 Tax=Nostoc sp. (strain PCC 7120 / SAG 25.82 / UTEX 2576) TaxID=103690 RepID=UPI0005CACEF2|nr:VapE domain-containing protein [Nostoc sp. PCC 7120 = FACHB-418]